MRMLCRVPEILLSVTRLHQSHRSLIGLRARPITEGTAARPPRAAQTPAVGIADRGRPLVQRPSPLLGGRERRPGHGIR